jgi:hypothetical protein
MRSSVRSLVRTPVRLAIALITVLVVSAGTALAAVSITATATFTSSMQAAHSGKCAQPASGRRSAAQLRQQACTDSAAQQFEFSEITSGIFMIRSASSKYCVDVFGASLADGAQMIQWADCHGAANQRFALKAVSGAPGQYMVVAQHSGKCIDVSAGSQADGAVLVQWACGDPATAGEQVWKINDAPAPGPTTGVTIAPTPPVPTVGPSVSVSSSAGPTSGPTSTAAPGAPGSNDDWGKALPPIGAPMSRAYSLIYGEKDKGYQPKAGECSWEMHARYWTWGEDGKVYPTWHPARDPSGCSFGHEHGDDPRTSPFFAKTGWSAFGCTNELLAPSNPSSQRNEDHVGHKVAIGNGIATHVGNDPRARVDMNCDAMIKFHQGTHSPDALVSNLHELYYNLRCVYTDNGAVTETQFRALTPIGHPGSFNVNNLCDGTGNTVHDHVGTASPADSKDGGFSSRRIADDACAKSIVGGNGTIARMDELWQVEVHARNQGSLARFDLNPYLLVANASRYYDPAQPSLIGRNIDLCYQGAKGAACDTARALTAKTGANIAWDDPRSPFTGSTRHFDPNRFVVQNNGATTLYTDVYGLRFSTSPFTGSVKQLISGNHAEDGSQGDIFMPYKNFAANSADGIHAPN